MINHEQVYKLIVENSPNGIIYFDTKGNIVEINQSTLDIFDATREEFFAFNVLTDTKNDELRAAVKKSIETGNAIFSNWHTTSISRKRLYIDVIFRGIYKNEKLEFVLAAVRDRTKEMLLIEDLERSKKDWKSIIDNMMNLFLQTDKDGYVTKISPSVKKILGYDINELIGKNISNFWYDKNYSVKFREKYLKNLEPIKYTEMIFKAKGGKKVVLNGTISPRFDEKGNYAGSDNFAEDITKQKEREKELVLYKKIIENTSEGVVISDKNNKIIYVNSAFSEITGYTKSDVIGKEPAILKSSIHSEEFYKKMWDSINAIGSWSGEIWNRSKSGKIYPEFLSIDTIYDENREVSHYIAVITDISNIKENERKMKHMIMHDSLTSLPNRLMFEGVLEHAVITAKRRDQKVGVLFLDIDNFKMINDNYGHHEGDKVLKETAERLKNTLRSEDLICRFGGDEFVVLLEHIKNNKDIMDVISKIQRVLEKPYKTEEYVHYISCSIGVSVFPSDAQTCVDMIKHADTAMYEAKKRGKNRYSFYLKKLGEQIEKELHIANLLRDAVKNNEFELYFQPKISTISQQVTGLEALVRWNSPELGFVSPLDFISIAEKTQLIVPIGEWVLFEACSLTKQLIDEGIYNGTISVNVSGVQLNHDDISEKIENIIEKTGINPKMLDLEITESVLMNNPEKWVLLFDKIKKMGIYLSIDDFGTGYSSLSYLREFPIDELKIDKSFVNDLPYEKDACVIAKTIIVLAKSLGFKIVAEGVETEEQMLYLKDAGCDMIQGYFYSKPLSFDKLRDYLKNFTLIQT